MPDHHLIFCCRQKVSPPVSKKQIRVTKYENYNKTKFKLDLDAMDWTEVFQSRDLNGAWELFALKFLNVLDKNAPWITICIENNLPVWITSLLLVVGRG